MAIHKLTLLWEMPSAGVSESWFVDAENPANCLEIAVGWIPFRLKLAASGGATGQPARLIVLRAQELGTKNIRLITGDFKGTYAPTGTDSVDMPWTGILVRISDTNDNFRMLCMRGVPDDVVEDGYKLPIMRNAWLKAFFDFTKATVNGPFRIQANTVGGGNPLHDIATLTANAAGLLVTTAVAHGLATNDYIVFHGVEAAIKIQGKYRIQVLSSTSFQVFGFNVQNAGFLRGQYREFVPTYGAINDMQVMRKANRKAGRPFFLLRGRR